jgi:phosphoribosylaminoimidazole-succinocarboxamide synthase
MLIRDALESVRSGQGQMRSQDFVGVSENWQPPTNAKIYRGKVRDVVFQDDRAFLIQTDRLSAFDRAIGVAPLRGCILASLSNFWFKELSRVIRTAPCEQIHSRILQTAALQPVRAEIVVRGYLAGSMTRAYVAGERDFCGHRLPEGLKPSMQLPHAIITPTSKAAAYQHDEPTTAKELIQTGVVTEREWQEIEIMALAAFSLGTKICANAGLILVDTKYEFGRDRDGKIALIDEAHTPDSSRFWKMDSYQERLLSAQDPEMFDKENVRKWLLAQGFSGLGDVPKVPASIFADLSLTYLTVAEKIMGRPLSIDTSEVSVEDVLRKNLQEKK